MADMPAEDALNNNDMVKRYIAHLQRRKSKKCRLKRLCKFLKCYKTRIFASILCVALITAIFFKIQSESLPPKKPNKTKKHVVELQPMKYDHAGKVVNIREKQHSSEDKIRFMHRTFDYVRANIKQDGGYVNTEQANSMINDALQLYDPDKGGVADYACLNTGASILATPDTYNPPLSDHEIFEFHIKIIYSQPSELITPHVTPGQCFAFWGDGDKQITCLQKNYFTVFTMENAPEAVIGDQKIVAPGTFAIYGFAHPKRNQIMAFTNVELRILDNHCHEDLTCVYHVRVYGNPH